MRLKSAAAVAIAVLGLAYHADASTIVYDNGGPGQYESAYKWVWTADDFVLTGQTSITDAHFYYPVVYGGDRAILGWAILGDDAGAPGSPLVSGAPTAVTDTLYCSSCWGDSTDIYTLGFDLDAPVLLSAGTYWFAVSMPNTFLNATSSITGTEFYWGVTLDGLEPVGQTFVSNDLAFQLTGQAVPEPATLMLLGTGLAAVVLRRRFSKRT